MKFSVNEMRLPIHGSALLVDILNRTALIILWYDIMPPTDRFTGEQGDVSHKHATWCQSCNVNTTLVLLGVKYVIFPCFVSDFINNTSNMCIVEPKPL